MANDKKTLSVKKRYIQDFIKVGRTGSKYFVHGAPEGLNGPYETSREAERVYDDILNDIESYDVIDRKLVRKDTGALPADKKQSAGMTKELGVLPEE